MKGRECFHLVWKDIKLVDLEGIKVAVQSTEWLVNHINVTELNYDKHQQNRVINVCNYEIQFKDVKGRYQLI